MPSSHLIGLSLVSNVCPPGKFLNLGSRPCQLPSSLGRRLGPEAVFIKPFSQVFSLNRLRPFDDFKRQITIFVVGSGGKYLEVITVSRFRFALAVSVALLALSGCATTPPVLRAQPVQRRHSSLSKRTLSASSRPKRPLPAIQNRVLMSKDIQKHQVARAWRPRASKKCRANSRLINEYRQLVAQRLGRHIGRVWAPL